MSDHNICHITTIIPTFYQVYSTHVPTNIPPKTLTSIHNPLLKSTPAHPSKTRLAPSEAPGKTPRRGGLSPPGRKTRAEPPRGRDNARRRGRRRSFNKRCAEIAPLPRAALFTGPGQLSLSRPRRRGVVARPRRAPAKTPPREMARRRFFKAKADLPRRALSARRGRDAGEAGSRGL